MNDLSSSTKQIVKCVTRPLYSGPAAGTRVNSDPESLLRFGLPIENKGPDIFHSPCACISLCLSHLNPIAYLRIF